MSKQKEKILKVTLEKFYVIPINKDGTTINGTIDELVNEWFIKFGNRSHVTREGHEIYGADKFVKSEVMEIKEFSKINNK